MRLARFSEVARNDSLGELHDHYDLCSSYLNPSVQMAVFLFSLGLWTLFGNVVVLGAGLLFRNLRSGANTYVISMASADLLVAAVELVILLDITVNLNLHDALNACAGVHVMIFSAIVLSDMNVAVLSVDRYFSVVRPAQYHAFFTDLKVRLYIALSWVLATAYGVLSAFGPQSDSQQELSAWAIPSSAYSQLLDSTNFAVCCVITVVSWVRIRSTVKSRVAQSQIPPQTSPGKESSSDVSATGPPGERDDQEELKMFLIVSAFMVTAAPLHLVILVKSFTPGTYRAPEQISVFLLLTSSAFRFCIYPLYSPQFRRAMKPFTCCFRGCTETVPSRSAFWKDYADRFD